MVNLSQIGASTLESHVSSFSKYLMQQTSLTDLSIILAEQREVSGDLAYGLLDIGLTTVTKVFVFLSWSSLIS